LRALDSELSIILERAQRVRAIRASDAIRLRNKIAKTCRRESNDSFGACLLNAEVSALQWVAIQLGEFESAKDPADNHLSFESSPGLSFESSKGRVSILQKQLAIAEGGLRSTGNPDLTIATLLELIATFESKPESAESLDVIAGLKLRLRSGCDHGLYGDRWQGLLESNALSCTQLRLQNPLYSSTDFY